MILRNALKLEFFFNSFRSLVSSIRVHVTYLMDAEGEKKKNKTDIPISPSGGRFY